MMLPAPRDFSDWKGWAAQLVKALTFSEEKPVAKTRAYTVAAVPPPIELGMIIVVTNETGGQTLATSDGTNWRRVKDGAIIS
jgi:hypothetical protein